MLTLKRTPKPGPHWLDPPDDEFAGNCTQSYTASHTTTELKDNDMEEIREELRQYILTEFLPGESPSNLKDDTPLRTSGILDSVAMLKLVSFIEERCGIEVEAHEAGNENFDSIDGIASFIEAKRSAAR